MNDRSRLGTGTLPRAKATRPTYAREESTPEVVHLGLGAFARAHLATYADDLLASGDEGAALWGVSLHSRATVDALAGQDGLYTLIESDGGTPRLRVIGSVTRVGHGPATAVESIAAATTGTVTLTITEKGYHHRAGGGLDTAALDVAHDLAHPEHPRSAPGVLVEGLARRRAAGLGGIAVVSADNLPTNGAVIEAVVIGLADRIDPGLAEWVEANVAFPSSVVDRIVPATTEADLTTVHNRLGLVDEAPVRAEPYRSWVIEQVPGLPGWNRVGACFVDDVAPFEARKLRAINGPHTAFALLGGLAGHDTIDEAVADEVLAAFVRAMIVEEVAPCLPEMSVARDDGFGDLAGGTLARFANPTLGHRCAQVATDTSQKLPQRIVAPLFDARWSGVSFERLALVVAAWAEWIGRSVETSGSPLADPLASELTDAVRRARSGPGGTVEALLELSVVFPPSVAADPEIRRAVVAAAEVLDEHGPRGAAEALT